MGRLEPREAALFAIIAVVLVLLGAVMVAPDVAIEQRATATSALIGVLGAVALLARRRPPPHDDGL